MKKKKKKKNVPEAQDAFVYQTPCPFFLQSQAPLLSFVSV